MRQPPDGLPIHTAACVSLVVFGLASAADGAVRASGGGFGFASGGSFVAGLGIAAVAVYALVGDETPFDSWGGVVVILSGVAYTLATVARLVG